MTLLHEPHHDGSPLYLSDEAPALGSTVTVRLRTHSADPAGPVAAVWLRTTYDAEPVYHPCQVMAPVHAEVSRGASEPGGEVIWWAGDLPVHNPVPHYRFLIVGPDHEDGGNPHQRWLTAAGLVEHDPPDTFDFKVTSHRPAPDWGRDGVVYQIFPDRFARSAAADQRPTPQWAEQADWDAQVIFEGTDPRTPTQFFGGDLDGITEHLDHIEEVGASILYTTPIFPGESNHRYNASTFEEVDPTLGGDGAYARLSDAVHQRGWRLLGDLTTNHTGDTHEWFRSAVDGAEAGTRDWYHFHPDGTYESWMGHHTLPKLNLADDALRAQLVVGPDSVVTRWLQPPYSLDGWRIDVANMTGRLGKLDVNHSVARAVRTTAESERADALVIGEHNHDASGDLDGDGWHGTMDYSGFSWPVWSWLRDPASAARPFGRPLPVARRGGAAVVRSMREWSARNGWRSASASWNILGSHDSARIRTLVGTPEVHRVAAGLQFTLPGVPMIFAGDEIGLEGVNGEDARRPMPWQAPELWDTETLAVYAALARARRDHVALRRGSLRWLHAEDDVIAYLREHPDETLLIIARRSASPALDLGVTPTELVLSTRAHSGLTAGSADTEEAELSIWRV